MEVKIVSLKIKTWHILLLGLVAAAVTYVWFTSQIDTINEQIEFMHK